MDRGGCGLRWGYMEVISTVVFDESQTLVCFDSLKRILWMGLSLVKLM